MSLRDRRCPLKRLKLICLCLALFLGGIVLPSAVLGYVAPNEHGVRLESHIPLSFLPEGAQGCFYPGQEKCFWNSFVETEDAVAGYYMGCNGPFCQTYNGLQWWYPIYMGPPYGEETGAGSCHYRVYKFEQAGVCNYDSNTYDYDGDGTFDVADANPDTPPSKMVKGNEEINTAYDKKQAETQGGG